MNKASNIFFSIFVYFLKKLTQEYYGRAPYIIFFTTKVGKSKPGVNCAEVLGTLWLWVSVFFGSKTKCPGLEEYYFMVFITYHTELNVQI